MTARIAELIGIAIIGMAILIPAPRITVHSPRLLYTIAMYKAAIGDTDSALRLLREAESNSQHVQAATTKAAGHRCQEPL